MELRMQLKGPSSTNLINRLHNGVSSDKDAARAAQRFGADSAFVTEVRKVIKALPDSGSQQQRAACQPECWVITQYRWMMEHNEKGTDPAAVRRVLVACVDEFDAMLVAASTEPVTSQTVVDLAHVEMIAGLQEDRATLDASHHKSPGTFRRLADACVEQIEALKRKAHAARVMAYNLTHRSA